MRAMRSSPPLCVDIPASDRRVSRLRRVAVALALGLAGLLASLPSHAMVELTGISKIAAGAAHTCALTVAGGVKCWGNNDNGQLGNNTTTNRLTPVDVYGLANGVAAIAAGDSHTCALTTAGGVKCWGYNIYGQLGDNTYIQRLTPVDVYGLASGVAAITAGFRHTCALTTAGGGKCWGNNDNGQLGDSSPTPTSRLTPVDVSGLASGVAAIAASDSHTCALTAAGGIKCWGANNYGQLGDNSVIYPYVRSTPVDVSGLASGVAAIAAGGYRSLFPPLNFSFVGYSCALTTAGGVKCWGANNSGQLGDNSVTNRFTPVDVSGLANGVTAIAAGRAHTCALTTAGGVKCWGDNTSGELGDNSTIRRLTPVDVSGLTSGVATITTGGDTRFPFGPTLFAHTCALTTGGGVKCWGDNTFGQLGDGTTGIRGFPTPVLTFYSTGTPSGGNSSLSLLASFNIAPADAGRTGSFYIAALLPDQLFFLTPNGFVKYTGGAIPAYATDTLSNRTITVLSGVNVTPFPGTALYAGYGLNDGDLIGNSKYNAIYTVQ